MARIGSEDGRLINGRYRLTEVIGRGGMGTVWHGRDETLDREVAIKEIRLPPDLDDEERSLLSERAKHEARATAALSHPGIITVFDVIEHEGAPMIVMEYVNGQSLATLIKEKVKLPWRQVARIGADMLDALSEAHAAGIVHRDLKPANVLLRGKRVIITDFGIAHRSGETTLSGPGELVGTPAFMAPEQAEHAATTPASDLWSLGATLFAAVEGRPPYAGPDFVTILLSLLTQEPAEPRSAGPLGPVIGLLLRKDPARRATAEQTAAALAKILSDDPATPATRPPAPEPLLWSAPGPIPEPESTKLSPYPRSPQVSPLDAGRTTGKPGTRAAAAMRLAGEFVTAFKPVKAPSAFGRPSRRRGWVRRTISTLVSVGLLFGGIALVSHVTHSSSAASKRPSYTHPGSVPAPMIDQTEYVDSMAVSSDGTTVAVAFTQGDEEGTIELWLAKSHKRLATLPADATSMAFSPDGRTLATVDIDGDFRLWDLASDQQEEGVPDPDGGQDVTTMAFSADGGTVVFGSSGYNDSALGTWQIAADTATSNSIGQTCDDMTLSPDATTLACRPGNGPTLQLWTVAALNNFRTLPSGTATDVYALDGDTLATAGSDGSVGLSTIGTRHPLRTLPADAARIMDVAFDSHDEIVDVDLNRVVRVWNRSTGRLVTSWSAGK